MPRTKPIRRRGARRARSTGRETRCIRWMRACTFHRRRHRWRRRKGAGAAAAMHPIPRHRPHRGQRRIQRGTGRRAPAFRVSYPACVATRPGFAGRGSGSATRTAFGSRIVLLPRWRTASFSIPSMLRPRSRAPPWHLRPHPRFQFCCPTLHQLLAVPFDPPMLYHMCPFATRMDLWGRQRQIRGRAQCKVPRFPSSTPSKA
mmetsp:Transcript_4399/g.8479  ORF Transcript_4399/g.8479 Transcript_4399/m.8479 type:complete len:202 (+) Transcript_4399:1629-2234(+)